LAAWAEASTWLLGLVGLGSGLLEGAANDWLVLAIGQDFQVRESVSIIGLAVFLAAMTAARTLGTRAVDRYGRVKVQFVCVASAGLGLVAFILGQQLWLVLVGAGLWGLGAALGFPMMVSAAAENPLKAPARTSTVSTIAYTGFILGPALLGLLAGQVGYRHALLALALPLVVAGVFAPRLAPERNQ
jgi:MFS family permease